MLLKWPMPLEHSDPQKMFLVHHLLMMPTQAFSHIPQAVSRLSPDVPQAYHRRTQSFPQKPNSISILPFLVHHYQPMALITIGAHQAYPRQSLNSLEVSRAYPVEPMLSPETSYRDHTSLDIRHTRDTQKP